MEEMMKDEESLFPELDVRFAKFGPRFGAGLIDGIITLLLLVPITYMNVIQWKIPPFLSLPHYLQSVISLSWNTGSEQPWGRWQ
jgi:uncharacterized RDD family membrane protein YckC